MQKLNSRKIRWIIREKEKGELTNEKIAQTQHITPRRVRQLWREYRRTGSASRTGSIMILFHFHEPWSVASSLV